MARILGTVMLPVFLALAALAVYLDPGNFEH